MFNVMQTIFIIYVIFYKTIKNNLERTTADGCECLNQMLIA